MVAGNRDTLNGLESVSDGIAILLMRRRAMLFESGVIISLIFAHTIKGIVDEGGQFHV
jgi:hypothetical protein